MELKLNNSESDNALDLVLEVTPFFRSYQQKAQQTTKEAREVIFT